MTTTKRREAAAPVRMAFAAFVLASLGAVAVVAVLLLQQPYQTQGPVNSPAEPSPVPTTVTEVPSHVATVAPPPPTQADSEGAQTVESVPTQEAVPEPPPTQTPPPRAPQGGDPEFTVHPGTDQRRTGIASALSQPGTANR